MAAYYILCVEDNDEERNWMMKNLAVEGRQRGDTYILEGAETPEEALKKIDRNSFLYHVVLTDMDFRPLSENTGQWLMERIIEIREQRGYDIAPEVICITGHPQMVKPEINNKVKLNGGVFILKGEAMAYVVEVVAALQRIRDFRSKGIIIIFQHKIATGYSFGQMKGSVCSKNELLHKALIDNKGRRHDIPLSRVPLTYLNILAKYGYKSNGLTRDEIFQKASADNFFAAQFHGHEPKTKNGFLNAIRRASNGLGRVLHDLRWNIGPTEILVTDYYEIDSGERIPDEEIQARLRHCRQGQSKYFQPGRDVYARYRLHANTYLEHQP